MKISGTEVNDFQTKNPNTDIIIKANSLSGSPIEKATKTLNVIGMKSFYENPQLNREQLKFNVFNEADKKNNRVQFLNIPGDTFKVNGNLDVTFDKASDFEFVNQFTVDALGTSNSDSFSKMVFDNIWMVQSKFDTIISGTQNFLVGIKNEEGHSKTLNVAKCPHHDLSIHIPTTLDCDADSVLTLVTDDLTKVQTIYAQGSEILIFATSPGSNNQEK